MTSWNWGDSKTLICFVLPGGPGRHARERVRLPAGVARRQRQHIYIGQPSDAPYPVTSGTRGGCPKGTVDIKLFEVVWVGRSLDAGPKHP